VGNTPAASSTGRQDIRKLESGIGDKGVATISYILGTHIQLIAQIFATWSGHAVLTTHSPGSNSLAIREHTTLHSSNNSRENSLLEMTLPSADTTPLKVTPDAFKNLVFAFGSQGIRDGALILRTLKASLLAFTIKLIITQVYCQ
jgi:hypothetical protein